MLASASQRKLHFLHIRKTGGTAVKHALAEHAPAGRIVLHEHATRLVDVPLGDAVFFFLRDPIARFISGFNSRLRQGAPRHDHPWSEGEREAFTRFPDPDSLILGTASPDTTARAAAEQAMLDIRHISSRYSDWLHSVEYLDQRHDDILLIGRQEDLETDFSQLRIRLGLPSNVRLPQDEVLAHRTPKGFSTSLSPRSRTLLQERYHHDYVLLDHCRALQLRR